MFAHIAIRLAHRVATQFFSAHLLIHFHMRMHAFVPPPLHSRATFSRLTASDSTLR